MSLTKTLTGTMSCKKSLSTVLTNSSKVPFSISSKSIGSKKIMILNNFFHLNYKAKIC